MSKINNTSPVLHDQLLIWLRLKQILPVQQWVENDSQAEDVLLRIWHRVFIAYGFGSEESWGSRLWEEGLETFESCKFEVDQGSLFRKLFRASDYIIRTDIPMDNPLRVHQLQRLQHWFDYLPGSCLRHGFPGLHLHNLREWFPLCVLKN